MYFNLISIYFVQDFSNNIQIDLSLNSIYDFYVSISNSDQATEYSDVALVNSKFTIKLSKINFLNI